MSEGKKDKAVVLLSGGQDSTTCLFWAKKRFREVVTITFDYGQRHSVELESAAQVAEEAGVEQYVLPMTGLSALGGSSLTDNIDVQNTLTQSGLPNTFVPGRKPSLHHLCRGVCFSANHSRLSNWRLRNRLQRLPRL